MKWIFIKYIHNLFHREMGERFRREVLAHGGEIPPKDLINGKHMYKDQNLNVFLYE